MAEHKTLTVNVVRLNGEAILQKVELGGNEQVSPCPLEGLIGNATTFCAEFRWAIALSDFEIAQRNRSAKLSAKCRRVSY